MVTDSASCSEAARASGIPPSTIQPYVQKARVTMVGVGPVPPNPNAKHVARDAVPNHNRGGTRFVSRSSLPSETGQRQGMADADLRDCVKRAIRASDISHTLDTGKQVDLFNAVFAVIAGRLTMKDSSVDYGFTVGELYPVVDKARTLMGRQPTSKAAPRAMPQDDAAIDDLEPTSDSDCE